MYYAYNSFQIDNKHFTETVDRFIVNLMGFIMLRYNSGIEYVMYLTEKYILFYDQ